MNFIFFLMLFILALMAALFVMITWIKQPKQAKWLPGCLVLLLVGGASVGYVLLGSAAHIIYHQEDAILRQIAERLETAVPLDSSTQKNITAVLQEQRQRAGAQPTVALLTAQLAMLQQDYAAACHAYRTAYQYASEDADIAVSYAQAWYLMQGSVTQDLAVFLGHLHQKYPAQTGLQNLSAVIAYNNHDYQRAIRYWQQLLSQYPVNSPDAQVIQQAIHDAKQREQTGH